MIIGILSLCFYSVSALASHKNFDCPAQIRTKQSLFVKVKGWSPWIDTENSRHRIEKVDFYDGEPKGLASLMPDNDADFAKADMIYTLNLKPEPLDHAVWVVCKYTDTKVTLMKKLPLEVKVCTVSRQDRAVSCK